MVPSAMFITTLHCPEAQRWNEVDIQFQAPSELEQSEPTAISPRAARMAAVEAPDIAGRRIIAHMAREVKLVAFRRLRIEDELRLGAFSALASSAFVILREPDIGEQFVWYRRVSRTVVKFVVSRQVAQGGFCKFPVALSGHRLD